MQPNADWDHEGERAEAEPNFPLTSSPHQLTLQLHSHPTSADGLLEGPTADSCEKVGRAMTSHTDSDLSHEVYQYLNSCELLLAAAGRPQPFTEEELSIITYYQAEVGKILWVSDASRN